MVPSITFNGPDVSYRLLPRHRPLPAPGGPQPAAPFGLPLPARRQRAWPCRAHGATGLLPDLTPPGVPARSHDRAAAPWHRSLAAASAADRQPLLLDGFGHLRHLGISGCVGRAPRGLRRILVLQLHPVDTRRLPSG